MSRQRSRSLPQPSSPPVCCFCGFSEDDEIEYGKLLTQDGIVTHYYCLLLSSNMEQHGNDDEGILGFLDADIQKELRRGKRLSCSYCKRTGATLGCCNTRCKRVFHLPCGLRAGSLHQFFGEFKSFCIRHRLTQKIDDHIKAEVADLRAVTCYICYEEVNPQNVIRTLWAPCCRKNAWFHRQCVQHLALSAGYFFKCPLCNNKQEFQKAMLEHGIYIPHQDASWELVPNAFQELLHRHNRCDANECVCPKGRTHTGVNAKWELVLCRLCGSQGIHKACGRLKWSSSAWECAECIGMLKKSDNPPISMAGQTIKIMNKITEEDSSSDSDISVGRNPSPLCITEREDSPPPVVSPFKLRPGPKSFKLQQVIRNVKSMEPATIGTSNTSLPINVDISAYIGSESSTNASSDEKIDDQLLDVENSAVAKGSPSKKNTSLKADSINLSNTNALAELIEARSKNPDIRIAEVITIDSDDDVEIINEPPKQNILTTKDGTKIAIYCLPQIAVESQKAEGDVNVDESSHIEESKSLLTQCKKKLAINDSTQSDTSSALKAASTTPTLIEAAQNKLNPELIDRRKERDRNPVTGRYVQNKRNPNVIALKQDSKDEAPMMNLKITNVTSLRLEDFANTSQELEELKSVNSETVINAEDVPSSSFPHDQQQLQLVEITDPTIEQKPHANFFQLDNSIFKDPNVKRKSEEYTVDKTLPNFPNSAAMEQYKRARICEPEKRSSLSQNANMSWNADSNNLDGAIPILVTSVPIASSEDNAKFSQTSSIINDIRLLQSANIQRMNGSVRRPSRTILKSSVQSKTNNDTNQGFVKTNKTVPVNTHGNSKCSPEASKAYTEMQPQLTIQHPIENSAASYASIQDATRRDLKNSLNDLLHFAENSAPSVTSKNSIPQVSSDSKGVAWTSRKVHQAPDNVNGDIEEQNESGRIYQSNFPLLDNALCNGITKNYTNTPTNNNESQLDLNNVPQVNNLVTQSDGFPMNSICDGDAGSSPTAEAGFTHRAAPGCPLDSTAESIMFKHRPEPTTRAQRRTTDNINDSNRVRSIILPETSPAVTGKHCDRPRVIPKKVPLQNLKFRVLDSNIVQMLMYDIVTVNINLKADNQQDSGHGIDCRSSTKKENQFSSVSKAEDNDDISFTEECGPVSLNPQYCKDSAVSPEIIELPKRSPNITAISGQKLDVGDVLGSAGTITCSKTEASRSFEEKCSIERKIFNVRLNDSLLKSNDENYCSPNEKKSLVFPSFKNDERKNLCAQESRDRCLKNSIKKEENVVATNERKRLCKNLKITSVETIEDRSETQRFLSVDFSNNSFHRSRDKDETKPSNGFNKVSKRLLRDSHNLSELDSPVNCYNNFKKVMNRSSEVNYDNCNSDTNAHDSLKSNGNKISDFCVDENNKVSGNNLHAMKPEKHRDNSRSNNSKVQVVNTNHNLKTSHVLSCNNINIKIIQDSSVATEKQSADITERITSGKDENVCNQDLGICKELAIQVKIDLKKIQNFIDSKPQLFRKRSWAKSNEDEDATVSSPSLCNSTFCRSSPDRMTKIVKCDTTKTHIKKKIKYDPNLFKENSES